jgi:hypothetical protein
MQPQSNSETVREDMDAQSRAYHKKLVVFESGVSITTSILQSGFPIEKKTSYPYGIILVNAAPYHLPSLIK